MALVSIHTSSYVNTCNTGACPAGYLASYIASLLSTIALHVLHTTLPLAQARPHDVEHLPSFRIALHNASTALRYA